MGQLIFFTVFILAVIAGLFAYFAPSQKPINPVQFMMDKSGYTSEVTTNTKRTQQLNMSTSRGIMEIRKQMDNLAVEQDKLLDAIKDQEQVLANANKAAANIMLEAQHGGGDKDILRLKALMDQMQDEQHLLVTHGQDLIALKNQLTKSRQWVADQIDLSNINNGNSLRDLQEHNAMLKDQSSDNFDQVNQHNKDLIADEKQKEEDQKSINQQRIEDQIQRLKDQQNR